MASQPLTGINQQPLVFAQIRNGSSSPEVTKARIVTSSRVINIKSNMFLHLFYNKPYQRDQGYNHVVDQDYGFQVKSCPADKVYRKGDILASGENDVGDMKTQEIAEREFLTLSDKNTWNFKPSVRVADFFANSLGVPIDCWTPCSRMAISRELEASDLIRYELQCGNGDRNACAMEAGELALALHDGDQMSFDDCDDLSGYVQLSILFVNANPDIQSLDFRLRMRIVPCRCPPVIVKSPKNDDSGEFDYYRAKLAKASDNESESGYHYVLDDEMTQREAECLEYNVSGNVWKFPAMGSAEEVRASNANDVKSGEKENLDIINMNKSVVLTNELKTLAELNEALGHTKKIIEVLSVNATLTENSDGTYTVNVEPSGGVPENDGDYNMSYKQENTQDSGNDQGDKKTFTVNFTADHSGKNYIFTVTDSAGTQASQTVTIPQAGQNNGDEEEEDDALKVNATVTKQDDVYIIRAEPSGGTPTADGKYLIYFGTAEDPKALSEQATVAKNSRASSEKGASILITVEDALGEEVTQTVVLSEAGQNNGDEEEEDDTLKVNATVTKTDEGWYLLSAKPSGGTPTADGQYFIYFGTQADPKAEGVEAATATNSRQPIEKGASILITVEDALGEEATQTVVLSEAGQNNGDEEEEDDTLKVNATISPNDTTPQTYKFTIVPSGGTAFAEGKYFIYIGTEQDEDAYLAVEKAQHDVSLSGLKSGDSVLITVEDSTGTKATQTAVLSEAGQNNGDEAEEEDALKVNATITENGDGTYSINVEPSGGTALADGKYFIYAGTEEKYDQYSSNEGVSVGLSFEGVASVLITVVDAAGQSETQTVTIPQAGQNNVATITGDTTKTGDEDGAITGQLTVTDEDGLTNDNPFAITTAATNGTATIQNDGNWMYTPNENFNGEDSFTVTITDDDGNTETQVIEVTVRQTDDVATITGDTTGTGSEDAGPITGKLTVTDADGLTNANPFAITTDGTYGTATIQNDGNWMYTPNDENFNGEDSFTVTITDDDGNTKTQVINVTFNQTDDVAEIEGDTTKTGDEDVTITGQLTVTDVDGLTNDNAFAVSTNGTNGTANIQTDGSWSYTPNNNFNGQDSFTVTITDDDGNTKTQVISVTVNPKDDVATITGDTTKTATWNMGDLEATNGVPPGAVEGQLTVTDADGLTNADPFAITTNPTNGTATIQNDGSWSYTLRNIDIVADATMLRNDLTDSFTVTITDDDGNTMEQVIIVNIPA